MLEKRVKRQVIARQHTFFIPTTLGLEKICAAQVRSLGLIPSGTGEGGVVFEGRLTDMYRACLHLSLANRVLMRIDEFKASNFPGLEKGLDQIPWELYLPASCPVHVRVTAHKSRLYHSRAIEERVQKSITDRLRDFGEKPPHSEQGLGQEIFVRAVSDRFTLSLDACGELMHKRGFKETSGEAPIRETLAAAILHLAGYNGRLPLMDPMCGSGTFSSEAALIAANIPPGWRRDFAFFSWPAFREQQWHYLRTQASEQFKKITQPLIFASDIDEKACMILLENLKNQNLDHIVSVSNEDVLSLEPPPGFAKPGLIVVNPPYGLRLGTETQARELFTALCQHLAEHFQGWKLAILAPRPDWMPLAPFSRPPRQKVLHHGGLKIPLLIGKIESAG
ncbi:MAG: class I SAM-dependent RNA methyltransferase [Desulfatibacillum sp.]|nr:class I SAM-dependent RNA methyltransferase [Desulfatibacillum sp.]